MAKDMESAYNLALPDEASAFQQKIHDNARKYRHYSLGIHEENN